jgi:hypothetical protein
MQAVKARFDGKVFVPLSPVATMRADAPVIVIEETSTLYDFLANAAYDDYVAKALEEAEAEAESTPVRYTHEEVFGDLRKSLQERLRGV